MNVQEKISINRELYGYQLTELIEQQPFGARYKGYETSSERPVSVIVFSSLIGTDPILTDEIAKQAEKLSVLKDPGIVQVLACKNGDEGCIWVEEYVQGQTLDQYLAKKGAIHWQQALRYIRQLLSGLEQAHQKNLLHEALHPGNILISRGNTAKLVHLGLSRIISQHSYLDMGSQEGDQYARYKAPEIMGNFEQPSAYSEIYTLGLIAYEMLTGQLPAGVTSIPFNDQASSSFQQITPPHTIKPSIPETFSDVIMKALEKHPIHRFQRADQMVEALSELQTQIVQPNVYYHAEPFHKTLLKSLLSRRTLIALAIGAIIFAGFHLFQPE